MPEFDLSKVLKVDRSGARKHDLVIDAKDYKALTGRPMPGGDDHVLLFPEYQGQQNVGPVIYAKRTLDQKGAATYSDVTFAEKGKFVEFKDDVAFGGAQIAMVTATARTMISQNVAVSPDKTARSVEQAEAAKNAPALTDFFKMLADTLEGGRGAPSSPLEGGLPKTPAQPATPAANPQKDVKDIPEIDKLRKQFSSVLSDKIYDAGEQSVLDQKQYNSGVAIDQNMLVLTPKADIAAGNVGPVVFARRTPTPNNPAGAITSVSVVHDGKVIAYDLGGKLLTQQQLQDPATMEKILSATAKDAQDPAKDMAKKSNMDEIAAPLQNLGARIQELSARGK